MINIDIERIKKSLTKNSVDLPEVNDAINSIELTLFGIHELISSSELDNKEKIKKVKELLFK